MGGSPSSNSDYVIYYAMYLQEWHHWIMNICHDFLPETNYGTYNSGPYDYELEDPDVAYLGTGLAVSSYPSVYDIYGKFVGGLNVSTLNAQITDDEVNSVALLNTVSDESNYLSNDIETNFIPVFQNSINTMNAELASAFLDSHNFLSDKKDVIVNKFEADLKLNALEAAQGRWAEHLDWNSKVVDQYDNIMRFYFAGKMDHIKTSLEFSTKQQLWPFTVLDNGYRDYISLLNGSASASAGGGGGGTTALQWVGVGLTAVVTAIKVYGAYAAYVAAA